MVLLYVGGICSIKLIDRWNVHAHIFFLSYHLPMVKVMCFCKNIFGLGEWKNFVFLMKGILDFLLKASTCHVTAPGLSFKNRRKKKTILLAPNGENLARTFYAACKVITVLMNKIRGFMSPFVQSQQFSSWFVQRNIRAELIIKVKLQSF